MCFMTISRFFERHLLPACLPAALLTGFAATGERQAQAAPPKSMSFTLTARLSYRDGSSAPAPAQTIDAKVWIAGRKARLESSLGGRPLTVIYVPPYAYRLLPSSKIGQRYRADQVPQMANLVPGTNGVSPDPSQIRAALLKGGARKAGTSTIDGTPVDVYRASRFRNRPDRLTAYLRRSDGLPLRVLVDSKNFSVVASWRSYRIGAAMPASLFSVPQGYRVRDARAPR
jgi:hypothetical protein